MGAYLIWGLTFQIIIDHKAGEIIHLVASVRPSVRLFVSALLLTMYVPQVVCVTAPTPEPFFYWRGVVDIGTWLCQVQQKVQ